MDEERICSQCGYDLGGLRHFGQCPECGQDFDATTGLGLVTESKASRRFERGDRFAKRLRTLFFIALAVGIVALALATYHFGAGGAPCLASGLVLGGFCLFAALTSYLCEPAKR